MKKNTLIYIKNNVIFIKNSLGTDDKWKNIDESNIKINDKIYVEYFPNSQKYSKAHDTIVQKT